MDTRQRNDIWVRWDWLWTVIFYASVIIPALLLLMESNGRPDEIWQPLVLTAVLLVWHMLGMKAAHYFAPDWGEKPVYRLIIILGDILLWVMLVSYSPVYYLSLAGLYSQTFRHLQLRYAIIAAIILTIGLIYSQIADSEQPLSLTSPILWLYIFIGIAGIAFSIWISAIIVQSTQRRELITQLEQTQAELAASERREGMLAERQRLAREIHDTLAQGFTSIVMHLEAAEQALPQDEATVQKHLNQARKTARISLEQARRVVADLRPDLLEQQSLPEALARAAARWSEESGVACTLTTTGTAVSLHPDIEITLLRATQEALNNIRKHAQAHAVTITLSYMGDILILDVQDDGIGINNATPTAPSGGFGLKGMRERVQQCGGELLIESEPDEGTTLVVSIPIGEERSME
ncbi:MAG: sensor histidine kinase [Anaerolineales bacterium]|nr:sensor histidine kinase [Anaerolineales bacterium]